MRNALPRKPRFYETGIVNLDSKDGPGTHWVAYKKRGTDVIYFDSYGNLRPPSEIISYFRGNQLKYNYNQEQSYNTNICGHLCLKFLYDDTT